MTHICHLLDADAEWDQRVGLSQLLDRLSLERYAVSLATIDPRKVRLVRLGDRPVKVFARRGRLDAVGAPALSRFVEENGIDLIHAWGAHAASSARAATERPLVIELFDPVLARRDIRLIRTLARPRGFAVICSCEIVRRRLIEGGLPPDLAVVIRPGVDFAQVNVWRRGPLRKELGLSREHTVIIVPEPVTREGGQYDAFRAAALLNALWGKVRLIVPGTSGERRRIERLAPALPVPPILICPGNGYRMEQLIAVSDVLVLASRGDVSTTSIAWAMASDAAVIGSAVYSVAEMIANKVNGLLFKQTPGKSMVVPIARLLQDSDAQAKAREVARGQAYEVFSLRRYVEQHVRLYENVLAGGSPSEGITDPARTA